MGPKWLQEIGPPHSSKRHYAPDECEIHVFDFDKVLEKKSEFFATVTKPKFIKNYLTDSKEFYVKILL
jgi:hypothetical protein